MKKALLVVDLQEGYFQAVNKGKENKKKSRVFINNVNKVISKAEKEGNEIIYIRQECPNKFFYKYIFPKKLIEGDTEVKIYKEIKKCKGRDFTKMYPNAFKNKELNSYLKENEIDTLEIIGADATKCVYSTSVGAVKLGYKVSINLVAAATFWEKNIEKYTKKLKKNGINLIGDKNNIAYFELKE